MYSRPQPFPVVNCHKALRGYKDDGATADDLREAIQTLEDAEPIARRVLGGSHPLVAWIEQSLLDSRAFLVAREKSSDEEKDSESK